MTTETQTWRDQHLIGLDELEQLLGLLKRRGIPTRTLHAYAVAHDVAAEASKLAISREEALIAFREADLDDSSSVIEDWWNSDVAYWTDKV